LTELSLETTVTTMHAEPITKIIVLLIIMLKMGSTIQMDYQTTIILALKVPIKLPPPIIIIRGEESR
jgi:hypothetical protein